MNKYSLDQLDLVTDEMLAGLHADQQMKMRIRAAATGSRRAERRQMQPRLVPALCCAALVFMCAGVVGLRGSEHLPQTAMIATIAAGDPAAGGAADAEAAPMARMRSVEVADLGDHARVGASSASGESLYARGEGDMPLVTVDGAVYRMLTQPRALSGSLRGSKVGSVQLATDEPSLASGDAMNAGLSNVADEGAAVYAVSGLSASTAVAAEVNGQMRLFQRVSYAGKGPGRQKLEDTFDVRGKVKSVTLSGVGTLSGDTANAVIAVLLDGAALKSADAASGRQTLTVTLTNGLKLQLGVSGNTLTGCGSWNCPEFVEAFEAAL